MYHLFELYGIEWIDALNAETLKEIKEAILTESKKEEVMHFRVDNGDVPITFCGTDEFAIKRFLETIESLDQSMMLMHERYVKSKCKNENNCQKIISTRPCKYKETKIPQKTTKKHKKKIMRSNRVNRQKRYY